MSSKVPLTTAANKQNALSKLEECMRNLEGAELAERVQIDGEVDVEEAQELPLASAADLNPPLLETHTVRGKAEQATAVEQDAKAREADSGSKEKQLLHLGLVRDGLSEQGRGHLDQIAGVSQQLGLATTDKAAVLAAVVELCQQQWAVEDSQAGLENVSRKVQSQMEVLREHAERLRQVEEEVGANQASRGTLLEEKLRKKVLNDAKADNYAEELSKLQSKLDKLGFKPELRHEALAERSKALAAKHVEIEQLQQKLAFFKDLPADRVAAEQIYSQKHGQMLEATRQFESGLAEL